MTHTAGVWDGSADELMDITDQMRMPLADAVKLYAQSRCIPTGTRSGSTVPGDIHSGPDYRSGFRHAIRAVHRRTAASASGNEDSFYFPPETSRTASPWFITSRAAAASYSVPRNTSWAATRRPSARVRATQRPDGAVLHCIRLVRLYQMLLNGGTLDGKRYMARPTVDLMTQVYTAHLPNLAILRGTGWGLTFEVISNPNGNFLMYSPGTFGHGGAFGTAGWIDRRKT